MKKVFQIIFLLPFWGYAQDLEVSRNLKIKGNIAIDGSTGIQGQVLTSNGTSSPTWETPASQSIPTKALIQIARNSSNIGRRGFDKNEGTAQSDTVDLHFIRYRVGNDISVIHTGPSIGEGILIHSDGLYRIEAGITLFVQNTNSAIEPVGNVELLIKKSGGSFIPFVLNARESLQQSRFSSPFSFSKTFRFAFDYYFESGDIFNFKCTIAELSNFPQTDLGVLSEGSFFTVKKISD